MRSVARVLAILSILLCAGLAVLPPPACVQAAPVAGGPRTLRVRACLLGAHQQLAAAESLVASGNAPAMNAAIGRAVLELERASVLLNDSAPSPLSETVEALLADFTATDLTEVPEVAVMLLERGGAELEAILSSAGGLQPQAGAAGRISLSPPAAEFGIMCPGEEREIQIQVTNKSTTARTLELNRTPSDPFSVSEDSPTSVAAGETVPLTVKFTAPQATGRFRKAAMLHARADGQRDAGIFLNVMATVRLVILEPDPLDFDEVTIGEKKQLAVTVRNCVDQQINATVRFQRAHPAFLFAPGQAQQIVLPPGGTVQVGVVFAPRFTPEEKATLQVVVPNLRGRLEPIGSGMVVGRGKEPVKVGATKLNFGTVAAGQFHTRTVSIANNTSVDQEVTIDRTRLHSEYWGVSPAGAVKLPPNSVTLVSLRFGAIGRCQHRGTLLVRSPRLRGGKASVAVSVLSR